MISMSSENNVSNPHFNRRESCPVCNSKIFLVLVEQQYDQSPLKDYLIDFYSPEGMVEFEYLDNAKYTLCKCRTCKSIFQRDIPNDMLMERLYEYWMNSEIVFKRHQAEDDLKLYLCYSKEVSQIISFFNKKPSSLSFFDFGMGWGKYALMAKAFGCNSYGTELSTKRIEHAKSNGINVITWEEIQSNHFDFINTEQVFEHIPEPLTTLRYLKKALKPGGILKISVPTAHDMERRLKIMDWKATKTSKNSLNPVAPLEHINFFTRDSLLKMAEIAEMQEVFIPLKLQYATTNEWTTFKAIAKNIVLPVYRNLLKRQNYVLLRNKV